MRMTRPILRIADSPKCNPEGVMFRAVARRWRVGHRGVDPLSRAGGLRISETSMLDIHGAAATPSV
jgi:hypothetical protein